jgi:hypothetical protein
MNHLRTVRILLVILVCATSVPGVRAQHVETRVENAEVVYVAGNDVIVKLIGGEVKQFEIPDSYSFAIDGKNVTVRELKPGMKLTATIPTATAPRVVEMVRIVDVGTVWKAVGRNLLVKTPEGENKMYRVPSGATVTIGGKEKTLDQLQEGDKITATVVTTRAPGQTASAASAVHQTPATPPRAGVLLIDEGAKPIVESSKPAEPAGTWGTPTIIMLVVAVLLIAVLVLLAYLRRQKKGPKNLAPPKTN